MRPLYYLIQLAIYVKQIITNCGLSLSDRNFKRDTRDYVPFFNQVPSQQCSSNSQAELRFSWTTVSGHVLRGFLLPMCHTRRGAFMRIVACEQHEEKTPDSFGLPEHSTSSSLWSILHSTVCSPCPWLVQFTCNENGLLIFHTRKLKLTTRAPVHIRKSRPAMRFCKNVSKPPCMLQMRNQPLHGILNLFGHSSARQCRGATGPHMS